MSPEAKSEFWNRHLSSVEDSLMHYVPSKYLDIEEIKAACGALGFSLFLLDSLHIRSTFALMDTFARVMSFPSEFGRNWDALLDQTRDLSWLNAKGYVLVLADADSLLTLPNDEFSIFVLVLEATVRGWRDERGEYGERSAPIAFHVIFSGSALLRAGLLKRLKEPLCDHETEDLFRIIRIPRGLEDHETFSDAKRLVRSGAELELVLSFLRDRGAGQTESTYMVAGLTDKSVPEAKAIVESSQTWSDRYEMDAHFRNATRQALRDLGFS